MIMIGDNGASGTSILPRSFARVSRPDSNLSSLVKHLGELGERQDKVSVHDIRGVLGERSFGPFLAIPALIEITPIGGIPGLPTAIALVIALISAQLLFGGDHL